MRRGAVAPRPTPALLLLLLLAGCAPTLQRHAEQRRVMGVDARIVCYAPDAATARRALDAAFARITALDAALSDWRDDSELAALVAAADGTPRVVSPDLAAALRAAIAIAEESGGAFDPSIAPLTALWRRARRDGVSPDPHEIAAARARVGWRRVRIEPDGRVALEPGTALDLGGIGKGFAADAALAALRASGVPRAIVDLGGDLVAGAAPPGRRAWRIALVTGHETAALELDLVDRAVATSGDAEQRIVIEGRSAAHLLDPARGLGLSEGFATTVIAPRGAEADALATAIAVMPETRAAALLAARGAVARVLRVDAEGRVGVRHLGAFPGAAGDQASQAR